MVNTHQSLLYRVLILQLTTCINEREMTNQVHASVGCGVMNKSVGIDSYTCGTPMCLLVFSLQHTGSFVFFSQESSVSDQGLSISQLNCCICTSHN